MGASQSRYGGIGQKMYVNLDKQAMVEHDVKKLHDAMAGLGTDEANLIRILANRSPEDLEAIRKAFQEKYGRKGDLIEWIKDDTSGDFQNVMVAMAQDPAEMDADALHKAMKGLGTDDDALIQILTTRSPSHLARVTAIFDKKYGKGGLLKWIEDDTSGDYQRTLKALLDPPGYYAEQFHDAIAGFGTDDSKLQRLLASLKSNDTAVDVLRKNNDVMGLNANLAVEMDFEVSYCPSLLEIKKRYLEKYKKSLEDHIKENVSGNYGKLCSHLFSDPAERDAAFIHEAIARPGTNEDKLVLTLITRSPKERQNIAAAYYKLYGKAMTDDISDDTSFRFKQTLLALVTPREEVLADALHKAMKGLGTDDAALIRVLVHRTPLEVRQIAEIYERKYKKSLLSAVNSETSGWFNKALCYIIRQGTETPAIQVPISMTQWKKDVDRGSGGKKKSKKDSVPAATPASSSSAK